MCGSRRVHSIPTNVFFGLYDIQNMIMTIKHYEICLQQGRSGAINVNQRILGFCTACYMGYALHVIWNMQWKQNRVRQICLLYQLYNQSWIE